MKRAGKAIFNVISCKSAMASMFAFIVTTIALIINLLNVSLYLLTIVLPLPASNTSKSAGMVNLRSSVNAVANKAIVAGYSLPTKSV